MNATYETASASDIAGKLDALITLLSRPQIPADRALWDADEVAAYLKISPRTWAEKFALRRDAPEAILLSKESAKSAKRWKAAEVMAWAERQR